LSESSKNIIILGATSSIFIIVVRLIS